MVSMIDVHAVILAGGSGSRLWPLSRQHQPKLFLSPVIKAESILIVTQASHGKGGAYPH